MEQSRITSICNDKNNSLSYLAQIVKPCPEHHAMI